MSRAWKQLPTHLPGWDTYNAHYASLTPTRKNPFKRKRLRHQRSRRAYPKPNPESVSLTDFRPRHAEKLLLVESPKLTARSLWRRTGGHWECVCADPAIEWMKRVRHPHVVKEWLSRNHYPFRWLTPSMKTDCATKSHQQSEECPAEAYTGFCPSVSPENNTAPSLNSTATATVRPDVPVGGGLERNGTKASPLNAPA